MVNTVCTMGGRQSTLIDTTEFSDNLKCFNCGELLTVLPIYFYINKGNLCGRCPEILYDCYQNNALEDMIKLQKLPCRYKKKGCYTVLDYESVKKHELFCIYRQYTCPSIPLKNCPWIGLRSEMKKHYEEKHKKALMEQNKFLDCVLNTAYHQNIFIETMKKQFLFHVRYDNMELNCGLIYLEEPSEKKQYVFTLLLKNRERKYEQTICNTRFLDTYLINKNELYEIDFDRIDLLVNESRCVNFQINVTETENIVVKNESYVCDSYPQIWGNNCYQNYTLEALIEKQKFLCKYKKNGCNEILDDVSRSTHELICIHRQYSCPSIPQQCPWKGRRSEMKAHYEQNHIGAMMQEDKFLICFLTTEWEGNILIETMCKQFLFHMKHDRKILRCGLLYFEEPSKNKKYVFTLLLKNESRKYEQQISIAKSYDANLDSNNNLYEIDFESIDLLVNNSRFINYLVCVEEVRIEDKDV